MFVMIGIGKKTKAGNVFVNAKQRFLRSIVRPGIFMMMMMMGLSLGGTWGKRDGQYIYACR